MKLFEPIWKTNKREKLEEALAEGATAADLYRMACEDGGVDNVSVILARIK